MIFEVENLGNINHAKIDLSKNLILFTGQNNTGKTYLSYSIYGLGRAFAVESNAYLQKELSALFERREIEIDLLKVFESLHFSKTTIDQYKLNLVSVFGENDPKFLEKTKVNFYWEDKESLMEDIRKMEGKGRVNFYKNTDYNINVHVPKIREQTMLKVFVDQKDAITTKNIDITVLPKESTEQTLMEMILNIPLSGLGFTFIPAERIGVMMFSKDVFSNRFTQSNSLNPIPVVQYSQAIQNALRTQQYIAEISKNPMGVFADLANELEEKIIGGKIEVSPDGEVFLSVKNKKIKMQLAGSAVKSLSSLVLYLRFQATENTSLIIDEPEINLHPDNQRVVARILAKMVNRGIKVIVSTHSDYIIRELNHLMLMSAHKDSEDTKELMERYGYEESELLNPNEVGAYLFKRNDDLTSDVTEIPIDEIDGVQTSTINDVINEQNRVSEALYNRLVEAV